MRQEVSVRSEELLVNVEWEVTHTQRSPTWQPDPMGPRQPEKTGVRLSLQPVQILNLCVGLSQRVLRQNRNTLTGHERARARARRSAIVGVRPASSERALIALLTLVILGTATFLELNVFPELHALRAAASKQGVPAYPPSAVELDCFEAASRVARGEAR